MMVGSIPIAHQELTANSNRSIDAIISNTERKRIIDTITSHKNKNKINKIRLKMGTVKFIGKLRHVTSSGDGWEGS